MAIAASDSGTDNGLSSFDTGFFQSFLSKSIWFQRPARASPGPGSAQRHEAPARDRGVAGGQSVELRKDAGRRVKGDTAIVLGLGLALAAGADHARAAKGTTVAPASSVSQLAYFCIGARRASIALPLR